MTIISLDMNVADIVKVVPWSADIFRENRIDFCCGGKISLSEAVAKRGLDAEEVLSEVLATASEQESRLGVEPTSFGNKTLVSYIQEKYHDNVRKELPLLTPYITKLYRVHGEKYQHIPRVYEIFKGIHKELIEHTDDEDENVFPLILEFLGNPTNELKEKVQPHLLELEDEHENLGELLHELREITDGFTPPDDACGTHRIVLARLEALEKDTFEHVHLENNILFDRVREAI